MSIARHMPRVLALLAGLYLPGGLVSAQASAQIVPEPALVDFGQLYDGEPARSKVRFTNAGSEAVAVQRVHTTCGCTVATVTGPDGAALPSRHSDPNLMLVTLDPGESMEVGVEMVTAGANGLVEKSLQVFVGDDSLPPISVTVRAHVNKAFVVSPEVLSLGNIPKSGRITHKVLLQSQLGTEWDFDGVESGVPERPLPEWLTVTLLPGEGAARELELALEGPRPIGPLFARVRVKLTHDRVPHVDFTLHGVIMPDVIFDSGHANPTQRETLDFGQMAPDARVTRTLSVVNHDPSIPFVLQGVDVNAKKAEFFEVVVRTIEEGVSYKIDLTADGRLDESFFRGSLLLRSEHPDVKTKSIFFHGWVKKSG